MKTLPNGMPRYWADRVRNSNSELRTGTAYDIIDATKGWFNPIKRVPNAREMERELARLNR